MVRMISFARTTAIAALALGAGALIAPEPASAQGRHGFSAGGGRAMSVGGARGFAGPARGMAYGGPRMAYGPRVGVARAGVYGARGVYPARAYRQAAVGGRHYYPRPPGWRPPHYPRPRPPYYGGGWYGGGWYPYWGVGAGLGLGLASAAWYANDGYYANNGYYAADCWLERRTVRTNYGRRVVNVRVCPAY